MVFTPRTISLVAGGAVALFALVLAASWNTVQSLTFFALYNGIVILFILLDWLLTVKPRSLRAERVFERCLSLGAENPVDIIVENLSGADIEAVIKDEPPASFKSSAGSLKVTLPAGSVSKYRYTLEPFRRGEYRFGNINFRYRSRLGLFLRQFRVGGENNDIKVYPNIIEVRKYQLLIQKGHLIEAGIKSSRVVGLGTDFESLRDYQVDDEYRRINWGATARRGRLVSNQYEVDKSQNIILVLDSGRMMSGKIGSLSMLDHAVNAGLLLSYVGVSRDDKVGLLAFADRVKLYIPPRKGKHQLQKILAGLYNLQPEVVESDYRAACHYIGLEVSKRSLICFFTDLIDEEASSQIIKYASSLTRNHLVMCVALMDPAITAQARKVPSDSRELYEKGVAQSVLQHREKAVSILKNRGVVVVNVPPEELSVSTINKYLELKSLSRL